MGKLVVNRPSQESPTEMKVSKTLREDQNTLNRGTQRIVSVEYLFGRPVIASNFRLGKCHLELS